MMLAIVSAFERQVERHVEPVGACQGIENKLADQRFLAAALATPFLHLQAVTRNGGGLPGRHVRAMLAALRAVGGNRGRAG